MSSSPNQPRVIESTRTSMPPSHRLGGDSGLSVLFSWFSDRYSHVVSLDGSDAYRSIEGTPQQDWPTSPAIQQLSTETIDGKPTVLGVGCSGTTHFSVSVQQLIGQSGDVQFRFDWAARLSKPLTQADLANHLIILGSTYRLGIHRQVSIQPLTPTNILFPTPIDPTLAHSTPGSCGFRFQPVEIASLRTIQWSYLISSHPATYSAPKSA